MRSITILAVAGLLFTGIVAWTSACGEDEVSYFGPGVHAVVRATVRTADGAPVSGTEVLVDVHDDSACLDLVVTLPSDLTNEDGEYFTNVSMTGTSEFEACLEVEAQPPESSGLEAKTISGVTLDFKSESKPPDTAEVHFTLPPR